MRKLNQNGFGAIETLLIIVIVGILGFTGWWVWNSKDKANSSFHNSGNSQTYSAKKKAPTQSSSKNTQKYLTIKEWGVRAPYASDDTLSYVFMSVDNNGNISYSSTTATYTAVIISKNLATNYDCPGTNNMPSGAGGISRLKPTDTIESGDTAEQAAKNDPVDYHLINGYYYTFDHDQAACSDKVTTDTNGQNAASEANILTKSLIPKLEPIPTH